MAAGNVEAAAHSLRDHHRTTERLLHRHLLVEHHADEQRVVVVGEQLIGFRIAGEPKRGVGHSVILIGANLEASLGTPSCP